MNNKNSLYAVAGLMAILGVCLQLMHSFYGSIVLTVALLFGLFLTSRHVRKLEKELGAIGEYPKKGWAYGVVILLITGAATLKMLHITSSNLSLHFFLLLGIFIQSSAIRNLENKRN